MEDDSRETRMPASGARTELGGLVRGLEAGLIGRASLVERLAIGVLTGGHILLEGPPGLAKTRAARFLADALAVSFSRIQCTPDLMPADLTGTLVLKPDRGAFEFVAGPVFHSLVLVDEINRAPPKVQSALLEAMAERQVTVGGETRALPDPFMVVATQNSIEHEGTFPLPEAQLDRFMLHILLDYPGREEERQILDLVESEERAARHGPVERLTPGGLAAAREEVRAVHLAPALKDYIVRLVSATREADTLPELRAAIQHPVSPRGTLALAAGARARAFLHGRDFAVPEDVAELAQDVLSHRLVPTWRAAADGVTARSLVATLVERVPAL
ncbi:MoxR-like ATPase [Amaricoccus macauensis]|uniref:MoxR-like ATPase n=2 Tax=Amaricoccus macauensis TaxID=57001 RepID=A0A840SWL9_9RHOB|nr:MoxR-like ATPase [Amaricoccus macauensis]